MLGNIAEAWHKQRVNLLVRFPMFYGCLFSRKNLSRQVELN